ncbi:MAG: hypothetical protein ACC645_17190 [Pirellulales bacterium]
MSGLKRVTWVVALAVGICGPMAVRGVRAEPDWPVASHSVLLLTNCNVLAGVIHREGDRYRVEQESGIIRVPADDVLRVAASIDALYAYLREEIALSEALDHLRLARWCLHQGLPGYAAREILDARRLEPHHPAIGRLERELEFRTRPAATPPRPRSAPRQRRQHGTPSGHGGRSAFERDRGNDQQTPSSLRSPVRRNDRSEAHASSGKRDRSNRGSRNRIVRTSAERQPSSADSPHDPFNPDLFNRRYAGKP